MPVPRGSDVRPENPFDTGYLEPIEENKQKRREKIDRKRKRRKAAKILFPRSVMIDRYQVSKNVRANGCCNDDWLAGKLLYNVGMLPLER